MTNKQMVAKKIEFVDGKGVDRNTKEKIVYPAAVRMSLYEGDQYQVITFGYSPMGGRTTFFQRGHEMKVMSTKDFMNALSGMVKNYEQVKKAIGKLRYYKNDNIVIGRCDCCGEHLVSTANMDYVQRHYKEIAEKTENNVTMFSKVCYACQGTAYTKEQKEAKKEAKKEAVHCAACNAEIKSDKVVAYSVKEYGVALCYPNCQRKYKKRNDDTQKGNVQAPSKSQERSQGDEAISPANDLNTDLLLSQEEVSAILELDVEPASVLGQLQDRIEKYAVKPVEMPEALKNLNEELGNQVPFAGEEDINGASEASPSSSEPVSEANEDIPEETEEPAFQDCCPVCDQKLEEAWAAKYDVCPGCLIRVRALDEAASAASDTGTDSNECDTDMRGSAALSAKQPVQSASEGDEAEAEAESTEATMESSLMQGHLAADESETYKVNLGEDKPQLSPQDQAFLDSL